MKIDEILKILNIDKLDENDQNNIKEKLNDIIEIKAKEIANEMAEEEKEKLVEEYEVKFEEYKNDITSKFSNFLDKIFEEELVLPENIIEYARKGELYNELIEQFKIRLSIDEGLIKEEVKEILEEAKEEIEQLSEKVNDLTKKNLELEVDAQEFAAELYKRNKCDGLVESKRIKVLKLLEGINNIEQIDKKFAIIMESLGETVDSIDEAIENNCVCPKCGTKVVSDKACALTECPKCGTKMKNDVSEDKESGSGFSEINVINEEKKENVDTENPFDKFLEMSARKLRNNMI